VVDKDEQSENDLLRAQIEELKSKSVAVRSGRGAVEYWHCTTCGAKCKQGERCATHAKAPVNGVGINPQTGVFGILEVLK